MTDAELKNNYKLSDRDVSDLRLLINMTLRAESLGFEIKDIYIFADGTYYGLIFKFFNLKECNNFFKDDCIGQYPNFFINAYEREKIDIKKGQQCQM